ncbi:MAG: alpha/beta hydrolase [Mucilaginibacter sp.]|nr:alpha/beta hydrolase [Mucilaginibacter sp.]
MKTFRKICALAVISLMVSEVNAQSVKENYATVNGIKYYYVTAGSGAPLVLMHGAFSTIDKDYGKLIPVLAKSHKIIGIELQGHGHTADTDRPLTYEDLAKDVEQLLKQLNITKADFMGYSMGGGVALQIAITQPNLVRHLILTSTAYSPQGMNMANPDSLKQKKADDLDNTVWKKNYDKVAPNPANWARLKSQVFASMGTWKGFNAADIKNMKAPTLLIFGDEDMSTPEHQVQMFRLLGGGNSGDLYELPNEQLAILPGTTHVNMVDQTDLLAPIVTRFLATKASK